VEILIDKARNYKRETHFFKGKKDLLRCFLRLLGHVCVVLSGEAFKKGKGEVQITGIILVYKFVFLEKFCNCFF